MNNMRKKTGVESLDEVFKTTEAQGRAAFMPYYPIGYPTYDASLDAIERMAGVGVDGFEIGVPFSDPLADGPTIQAATQVALDNGITVTKTLEAVKTLRERGVTQPLMMFSYLNPLVAYGTEKFVHDAREAGADGLIIPDLPAEEAHMFADACDETGMALVFFLAPTSNPKRIKLVAEHARGFIYVVTLTGITGERTELPDYLAEFIARLRKETDQPLVMGFGISKPEHAQMMTGLVNGFIVGSALVKAGAQSINHVEELALSLRSALDN